MRNAAPPLNLANIIYPVLYFTLAFYLGWNSEFNSYTSESGSGFRTRYFDILKKLTRYENFIHNNSKITSLITNYCPGKFYCCTTKLLVTWSRFGVAFGSGTVYQV